MRCVIAWYPFDLTRIEVEQSVTGVPPEPATGVSVTIDRRVYPVMQVDEVITGQNGRDFAVTSPWPRCAGR